MSNTQDLMASLMGGGGDGNASNNDPTNNGGDHTSGDQDLFSDIPTDDDPPPATVTAPEPAPLDTNLIVPPVGGAISSSSDPLAAASNNQANHHDNNPTTTDVTPPPTNAASLLMQSGLLGDNTMSNTAATSGFMSTVSTTSNGGGGDGLFASVDQEEQDLARQQQQQKEAEEKAARERQQQLQQQQQEEERQRQQQIQQQQQQQQQQLQDQMQSVYLGNSTPTVPSPYGQPQPQPNYGGPPGGSMPPQQQPPQQPSSQPGYLTQMPAQVPNNNNASNNMDSFYRTQQGYPPQQQPQQPTSPYGNNHMHMAPPQSQPGMMNNNNNQNQNRYYQPTQTPSTMAGMHNASQASSLGRAPRIQVHKPDQVATVYEKVIVSEPILVAPPKGLLGSLTGQSTPHWSYQISTQFKVPNGSSSQQPPFWIVRRRFRHVVALEDRLHEEILGAILPPRPDKHATRALEEATAHQSAEFAVQRAAELQVYLNQLIQHPYAHNTHTLRLFLSLQDDVGTAWPEVSSNALTRLANASVGAAVKVSEQTQATKFPWQESGGNMGDGYGEDNAELLALANQEQIRMAAVMQAVPKLEGAITMLREYAERMGSTGMELGRLSKEVAVTDTALGQPMDIISSGMLRSGRRNKRLALELFAALHSYSQHYKSCRYEKMAFMDRHLAMMRRQKERGRADQRATMLYQQQQQQMYQQPYGAPGGYPPQQPQQQPGGYPYNPQQQQQPPPPHQAYNPQQMNHLQGQAVMSDNTATDAWQECDEIGQRLRSEINRLAYQRRNDWFSAVKVVASSYKEATTENVAIWAAVKDSFLQAFPQYEEEDGSGVMSSSQAGGPPPMQQP